MSVGVLFIFISFCVLREFGGSTCAPAYAMHVVAFSYGELILQNTKDYHWGVLGVTSIALEVGNAFDEQCASFLSDVLPRNLPALLYAAKLSRSPLDTVKGPDVMEIRLSPPSRRVPRVQDGGGSIEVSARVSDSERTDVVGDGDDDDVIPSGRQRIAQARVYVNSRPHDNSSGRGGEGTAMSLADGGIFGSTTRRATSTVNTAGLGKGKHTLCIRAMDTGGFWGPLSCTYFGVGCAPENCPHVPPEEERCGSVRRRRRCRTLYHCRWEQPTSPKGRFCVNTPLAFGR